MKVLGTIESLDDGTFEMICDCENIQEDILIKLGDGIKGIDALHTEFTELKTRYGVIGRTLLIIALETVKDKKRRKMLEDILEEEVKMEIKKHDKR